jgi:hypothetical protein
MAFLPMIFGIGSSLISLISSIAIFFTIKQWVTMALVAIVGIAMIKMGTAILEFLKSVASSSVGRYILGAIVIFTLGLGVGYCSHKPGTSLKDAGVQELPIRKQDSKTRSQGLVKDGKIYYPGVFINKHLERKGVKGEHFKETYP